jgi:hypothetical protein
MFLTSYRSNILALIYQTTSVVLSVQCTSVVPQYHAVHTYALGKMKKLDPNG